MFSALQFQADMGLLLAFIFLANMVGAIVMLPALVRWLIYYKYKDGDGQVRQSHVPE
jgi:predicted RND superfamily exporter protein